MNCETLYQESKWKKQYKKYVQNEKEQKIKQLSSAKKISEHSSKILTNKLSQMLTNFQDEKLINIETSIPLLFTIKILQLIQSIQSIKLKLEHGGLDNNRLKWEARFVYCLWRMIDDQEIQTRQLKQIIYMLNYHHQVDLKKSLHQIYHDTEAVNQFVEAWKMLNHDHQYYKSIEIIEKKHSSSRQIEKVINFQSVLKQKSNKLNEENEIQQLFSKNKKNSCNKMSIKDMKKTDLVKIQDNECLNSTIKNNKQNIFLNKIKQKQLINRLYQKDKYEHRIAKKQFEQLKRVKQELQRCTFKPQISHGKLRSASVKKRQISINGYEKAVARLKEGFQKSKIEKQLRQHISIGENYEKLRQMKINPPTFLQRKKYEYLVLFIIQFDLGRHKIKVKVHQYDTEESIANSLCKIYSLKADYYQQIVQIVRKEKKIYQSQQIQQYQQP